MNLETFKLGCYIKEIHEDDLLQTNGLADPMSTFRVALETIER